MTGAPFLVRILFSQNIHVVVLAEIDRGMVSRECMSLHTHTQLASIHVLMYTGKLGTVFISSLIGYVFYIMSLSVDLWSVINNQRNTTYSQLDRAKDR